MITKISEISAKLRDLSDDYSNQRIPFDEYCSKRKELLDEAERILNGLNSLALENSEKLDRDDSVDNVVAGVLSKVFDVFKKKDGYL